MSGSPYNEFNQLRAAIVRAGSTTWHNKQFENEFVESPLSAMRNELGYHCPFHMTLKVKRSNAANPHFFDPVQTGGWVGPNNTVCLYLPPIPKDHNQKAEALAAFYQDHPLFVSQKK